MRTLPARSVFLAGSLVAALTACGDEPAPGLEAAVDTVGGVERFGYPAEPAGDLGWSADTVAVLGDPFAEDVYQFGGTTPGGLVSDAAGNLYILDRQGDRVLKYGPEGLHLATYGREGEGPGELSQPLSMAVGPGDTVWVADFSNARITGFPQAAADPRTIPIPGEGRVPGQQLIALDDGFITTFSQIFGFRRAPDGQMSMSRGSGGDDEGPPTIPVLRLSRDLESADTLWSAAEPPMDMVRLETAGRLMVTLMSREFYPSLRWDAFADGGIVVSDSAAYVLYIVDPAGTAVRSIARAPAPRAATEADRDRVREETRRDSQEGGIRIGGRGPDEETRKQLLEQRLEKMTFADLIPRVTGLRVDPLGRIWVGVSEEVPDEVERIDLYDRDGTLLGELRGVPFPDVFLGPDRIGVLRRDELDVQQVVILEIDRPETELASD